MWASRNKLSRLITSWVAVTGLAVWSAACCSVDLDLNKFRGQALTEQIAQYETANNKGCHIEGRTAYLQMIADHGYQAAEAMQDFLYHPRASFSVADASYVLLLVHLGGFDLRSHDSLKALDWAAVRSSERPARQEAARVAAKIRASPPGS
jgi:hypothetical protein